MRDIVTGEKCDECGHVQGAPTRASNDARIDALEAAIREMHAIIPGGSTCDPQQIADALREIAQRVNVMLSN